ncbi:MAG: YraN family protein [Synergistaceae bacterium]|nr:YraN family protein [Synergistaceae bacterium]
MNNLDSNLLGRSSEDLAANYILSLGWPILARNVKNQYGELDIIAIDSKSNPEELVIIEVRARTTGKIQSAIDSIGPHKLRTLIKAGREVVNLLNWSGFWRIDVAGITFHDKNDLTNWTLEHVRDITAGMNLLS